MASAAGLIQKWYSDENYNQKSASYKPPEKTYNEIKLDHFYGVSLVCCILFVLAILAFVSEHVIYRYAKAPNPARIWMLLDIFINPDREFLL